MGFFSRLFGGGEKETQQATQHQKTGAVSGIAYDPNLVPKFKNDHQALFKLYGALTDASDRGDYVAIPPLLNELKLAFQTHIMIENVKFYAYLQQHLAADTDMSSFLSDVRREMDGIARALVKFVNTYNTGAFTAERAMAFKAELGGIGGVLTKRVQLEESQLYTLYLPGY